ncbi:MAG: DUF5060 domain-containing protein [Clostridia bacterium]|nr:DUF5060 domain-containing protein [Clostridia bacterium]
MQQYIPFELVYRAPAPGGSQASIDLTAVFSHGGYEKTVRGFYAGDGVYKVRFLPEETGVYTYRVSGVVSDEGQVVCGPSEGHGLVKAEGCHFAFEDGTRYAPFGTTVYALCHQPDELMERTLETLKNAPFNKIRMCVFPKHYNFNQNDPEFYPFERDADGGWDVDRPCFAFWDRFEKICARIARMGIQIDLILFHPYDRWGFSRLGQKNNLVYLDYLLRRLSAWPCFWWSMANEYDLFFDWTADDWYGIERFIHQNDPYGHLLSNHNCFKPYDFSHPDVTHVCLQGINMHQGTALMERFGKPVVFDECCYEGDIDMEWGNISAHEMTNRFWKACAQGAYATHGETFYHEDEILWWAKGGRLYGESPARIAFLREIVESLPGPLEPWLEKSGWVPVDDEGRLDPSLTPEERRRAEKTMMGLERVRATMTETQRADFAWKDAKYAGRCEDLAFIKYFAQQCLSYTTLRLPEDGTYAVELIDAWNMTREVVAEGVSGNVTLKMPGREGMALLARRTA